MAWVTTLELEISTGSQGKSHVCTTARYPTSPRTYGHYLVSDGTQREQWRASRTKNPYRLSTSTLVEFCEESFGEKGEGRRTFGSSPRRLSRRRESERGDSIRHSWSWAR